MKEVIQFLIGVLIGTGIMLLVFSFIGGLLFFYQSNRFIYVCLLQLNVNGNVQYTIDFDYKSCNDPLKLFQ